MFTVFIYLLARFLAGSVCEAVPSQRSPVLAKLPPRGNSRCLQYYRSLLARCLAESDRETVPGVVQCSRRCSLSKASPDVYSLTGLKSIHKLG